MTEADRRSRVVAIVALALAAYPLWWLAMFYLFVLRARWHLGYWPAPYHPDPKELGFTLHYSLVLLSSMALLPVAAGAALLLAVGKVRGALVRAWPPALLLLCSTTLLVLLVRVDPGRFLNWFGD